MISKNKLIKLAGLFLVCGLMLTTGCRAPEGTSVTGASGPVQSGQRLTVAVTIVPEQTFVKAVCADYAEVITLVPPGNSPENYEPTVQAMEAFTEASVYFTIGVATEAANILPDAGKVKVVPLHERVAAAYPERTFESGERDPHIWLSPKRVKVMIEAIAAEMSALDPAHAAIYQANAAAYNKQLDNLDAKISSSLTGVKNRAFVVYHPAFGYLADDYGLEMFALEEEGKEATPRHLQEMIDLAKSKNIKVIFYQDEIDSSQSASYAEEIGGRTIGLSPLAADYITNLENMAQVMAEAMQ